MTQREETETQGSAHRQLGSYKDQGMPSLSLPPPPEQKGSPATPSSCSASAALAVGPTRPTDPSRPGGPCGPPHPPLAGSQALCRYFVPSGLISEGPARSASILTKAWVWPGVGGADAGTSPAPSGPAPKGPKPGFSRGCPSFPQSPSQTGAAHRPSRGPGPAGGCDPPESGQGGGGGARGG